VCVERNAIRGSPTYYSLHFERQDRIYYNYEQTIELLSGREDNLNF
jgi:hypothetical protein